MTQLLGEMGTDVQDEVYLGWKRGEQVSHPICWEG